MTEAARSLELSKLLHERVRLGIMTTLATRRGAVQFNELLRGLQLTRGNLAVHLRKLEEAGYIQVHKGFAGRIPRTTYTVTRSGRRAFSEYLTLLEGIVADARNGPAGGKP